MPREIGAPGCGDRPLQPDPVHSVGEQQGDGDDHDGVGPAMLKVIHTVRYATRR